MPPIRSLIQFPAGFVIFFALFAFLESLNAHLALKNPVFSTRVDDTARLLDTPVEEVPDITPQLNDEGVSVGEIPHLSKDLEEVEKKYVGAQTRLIMCDSTDTVAHTNPSEEEKMRIINAFTAASKDRRNEIWIFSGQAMSVLLKIYDGVPTRVNFAAEWGAHVLYNERKEEELVARFDVDSIRELMVNAIKGAGKNIDGANFWPGYQRMLLVKYKPESSNREAVRGMVDQLYQDIESIDRFRGQFTVTHNADRGYFSIQRRGMGKATLAAKLMKRKTPQFVLSLGDSAQDETMHKTVKDKGFVAVIVSSDPNQRSFAEYKLKSVEEVHDLLEKMGNMESWPSE